MLPQVTSLYLGLLGFMYVALSIYVIVHRYKYRVGMGDGANPQVLKAVRIHGNFIEYVPLVLLMILVLELSGASPVRLHGLGAMLIAGRIAHFIGLRRTAGVSVPRALGVVLTLLALLVGAGSLLLPYFE